MRPDQVDKPFRIGFDRTSDAIELIPVSGEQFGEDICELIGVCTAALMELGDRMGMDQKNTLKFLSRVL